VAPPQVGAATDLLTAAGLQVTVHSADDLDATALVGVR